MYEPEASFLPDGSCRFKDRTNGTETIWPTVAAWATAWFVEYRTELFDGPASRFQESACFDGVPGVVDALVVLAETAGGDPSLLALVGGGPIEELASDPDIDEDALTEIERATQRSAAFCAAFQSVWLAPDVAQQVKARLGALGATVSRQ